MSDVSHRVLLAGAGSIGQRHLTQLAALGVTDLAVCDPQSSSLTELSKSYTVFSDYDAALQEYKPTVVYICSPTKFHISQAVEAANAGCHVFIEKPLSHTLDGIDELITVVEKNNLCAMVACNMRFHPGPRTIKDLLEKNAIGDVQSARIHSLSYLPNWRRPVPYKESYSADPEQGGVLLDCIHEIDLTLWYFGAAELTHASVQNAESIGLSVDGAATLSLHHESGTTSTVELSFIEPEWQRGCEITGSNGRIAWHLSSPPGIPHAEDADPRIHLYDASGNLTETFPAESDRDTPYRLEAEHFLQMIERGQADTTSLKEGRDALVIALVAKKEMPVITS